MNDIPDVGNIVELRSDIMQQLWPSESMSSLDLGTKVSENDDRWHLWPDENGSDEEFEMLQPFRIAVCQFTRFRYSLPEDSTPGSPGSRLTLDPRRQTPK
jgi:hypothetical protein